MNYSISNLVIAALFFYVILQMIMKNESTSMMQYGLYLSMAVIIAYIIKSITYAPEKMLQSLKDEGIFGGYEVEYKNMVKNDVKRLVSSVISDSKSCIDATYSIDPYFCKLTQLFTKLNSWTNDLKTAAEKKKFVEMVWLLMSSEYDGILEISNFKDYVMTFFETKFELEIQYIGNKIFVSPDEFIALTEDTNSATKNVELLNFFKSKYIEPLAQNVSNLFEILIGNDNPRPFNFDLFSSKITTLNDNVKSLIDFIDILVRLESKFIKQKPPSKWFG